MEKNETRERKRICEMCGSDFGCGAFQENCWCTSVELETGAASALLLAYKDCLCPKCLRSIAAPAGAHDSIVKS